MAELGDRLLAEVGVEGFYGALVGELVPKGAWLMAHCPFHPDEDPSFGVHREKGFWKCYAGCGEGDMVSLFARVKDMPVDGVGFRDTAKAIEKEFLNGHRPVPRAAAPRPKEKPPGFTKEQLDVFEDHAMRYLEAYPVDVNYPVEYGIRVIDHGTKREGRLLPVHHVPSGRIVSVKLRFLEDQPPFGGRKHPVKSINMSPWCDVCGRNASAHCFKEHRADLVEFPSGLMGYLALVAHPEALVVCLEGEKDLMTASRRLNLEKYCPCSVSAGASSQPEGFVELLASRRAASLYDADRSGVIGTNKLWKKVRALGGHFVRGDLREAPGGLIKGTPESKDVFDWFKAGGTAEALMGWVETLPLEDLEVAETKAPPPAEPPDQGGDDDGQPPAGQPERHGKDDRPEILWTSRVHEAVYASERHLIKRGVPLYSRLDRLCRVIQEGREEGIQKGEGEVAIRERGSPIIQEIPPAAMRMLMSEHLRFRKYDARAKDDIDVAPPKDCVSMLLEKGQWAFRPLEGFATAPFLRPDGSLCVESGYDPATAVILAPDQGFEAIPEAPTKEDAVRALSLVLEPFENFPFETQAHQAGVVAAMLSLAARPAIQGPCPMFLVSAPTPGTGKTLLVWMAVSAVTGKKPASTDWMRDDDEFRKTVISMGLAGDRAVLLDNVEGTVGSALLSNVLTSDEFHGRLLGVNQMVTTRLKMVWFATGNNLSTRADAYRRIVRIHLDPHMEFPTKRVFKGEHQHPMAYVRKLRATMVPALLTILRAYHLAGHPKSEGHVPTGSFESWDDWVRAPLLWAMGVDCREGTEEAAAETEPDRVDIGSILVEWHSLFPDEVPVTIRDVLQAASAPGRGTIIELLESLDPKSGNRLNLRHIGKLLTKHNKNIVNGLRLDRGPRVTSGFLWTVRLV